MSSSGIETNDAFWRFSLRLYAREGAAGLCLKLQDAHGCDVNVVLFALWTGLESGRLKATSAEKVVRFSREWRVRAVQPLRDLRIDLKTGVADVDAAPFREQVKRLELAGEKLQQQTIAQWAETDGRAGVDAAAENLISCLKLSGVDTVASEPDWRALLSIAVEEG
ncbi:MAG: TIGR02444 family protein [Neomegalonema sp.]